MLVSESKHIPAEDRDFFLLLRAGLWQRVEEPLSDSPDWAYIYRLACEQTVQGIVADGIGLYRAAYERGDFGTTPFPSGEGWGEAYEAFLSQTAQIIRQNYKVNQLQTKVCQLLNEGMPSSPFKGDGRGSFFIVKGQEAAKNYPHPMLRCSGDIDILEPRDQFDQAREIMRQHADQSEDFNAYLVHEGFFFGDVEVEIHGALHPNLGQRIDTHLDKLQEDVFSHGEPIDSFNAVYVFLHCLQHFHWSGLGIRQITDWCMLLAHCSDSINRPRVQQAISDMHLQQEWNHFLAFCYGFLGMPKGIYDTWNLKLETTNSFPSIFHSGENGGETLLWLACRDTGNMGHNRQPKDRIRFMPLRVLSDWTDNLRQYFAHRHISPTVSRELLKVKAQIYWQALAGKILRFQE